MAREECGGNVSPSNVSAALLPCVLQQRPTFFFCQHGFCGALASQEYREFAHAWHFPNSQQCAHLAARRKLFCSAPRTVVRRHLVSSKRACVEAARVVVVTRSHATTTCAEWAWCWIVVATRSHATTTCKGAWKHDFARFVALETVHAQLACTSRCKIKALYK